VLIIASLLVRAGIPNPSTMLPHKVCLRDLGTVCAEPDMRHLRAGGIGIALSRHATVEGFLTLLGGFVRDATAEGHQP
jgi:hypothetical protein